jgi:transcription-repair coupling factor (superfamily II helicase)
MLSFINNEADILISTTIIENGLDIPNANTIIVFDAQNFGLSELHQLRGRVGRSNRKAFCYLISPPEENLTVQARQRLRAIESFTELGSGFNIAMQDLDIRGAGNMLGGEQSGFINEIGIETYQKILDDAIAEIKEEEFRKQHQVELHSEGDDDKAIEMPEGFAFTDDCVIDTDMEVLLPSSYIQNVAERIRIYRRLDSVKTADELAQIADQLKDRFGEIPKQTLQLFDIVRIRWVAIQLGIEKITMKGGKMLCNFVAKDTFIHSSQLQAIFTRLTSGELSKICRIPTATADKLTLVVSNITNTKKALDVLEKINGK